MPKQHRPSWESRGDCPAPYFYEQHRTFPSFQQSSTYVEMPDGIRLAVTCLLPSPLGKAQQIPALLHQTRYWRAAQLRPPFSWISNGLLGKEGKMIREILRQGYAFINVDVRGSGASFGSRAHPWTETEVSDGQRIMDWLVEQPWCDGRVGTLGISYSGTAAEFLIGEGHPNLKAGVFLFSLFDVYRDIAFPGGVPFRWFMEEWGKANRDLDRNQLPAKEKLGRLLVKGVAPVEGEEALLQQALQDHLGNVDIQAAAADLACRDDVFEPDGNKTMDVFSPHTRIEKLNQSKVPIYAYSGWWDGAYQASAIRKYLNYDHPDRKLTIGPWEHRGHYCIDPHQPGQVRFHHLGEILKFLDQYVKGIDTGIREEPPIHLFSMGKGWRAFDQWPDSASRIRKHHFFSETEISTENPSEVVRSQFLQIVPDWGAGTLTRWRSMTSQLHHPRAYRNWGDRLRPLSSWKTQPLSAPLEIVGTVQLHLYLRTNQVDGMLIAYLAEESADGKWQYITEGLHRWSHGGETDGMPYKDDVEFLSYTKAKTRTEPLGGAVAIQFPLLPIAYQGSPGSRLVLVLGTADIDHFSPLTQADAEIEIFWGGNRASYVGLPVLQART
ncbi:MAG: CocE/NonD family hydrolase [Bacteroidota bacterium]